MSRCVSASPLRLHSHPNHLERRSRPSSLMTRSTTQAATQVLQLHDQTCLHDQDYLTIYCWIMGVRLLQSIQEDEAKKLMAMKNVASRYPAKHDNEQSDLLHRINLEKKNLQDLPRFTRKCWSAFHHLRADHHQSVFCQQFEKEVKEGVGLPNRGFTNDEAGQARWKDLFQNCGAQHQDHGEVLHQD